MFSSFLRSRAAAASFRRINLAPIGRRFVHAEGGPTGGPTAEATSTTAKPRAIASGTQGRRGRRFAPYVAAGGFALFFGYVGYSASSMARENHATVWTAAPSVRTC